MYDVVYIFRGILIGLMVSVPLGPMGVLIIQKTLHKGALAGFVSGMGAACADLFYATVAAFGLGFVVNIIQAHELLLQIMGGIFLLIVGLKIYFPIRWPLLSLWLYLPELLCLVKILLSVLSCLF